MPQQDMAGALVTERSKELLNYTWLKYVAILGVLNDLRKTIPILSRVHARDVGYMIDDVKKYHTELRKVGDQLNVTMVRIKQLGDIARRHGLNRGDFASAVTEVQGIFGRTGNSAQDIARSRRYEAGARLFGGAEAGRQFNALDNEKKGERYIELVAEYIAKTRSEGKMETVRKDLDAAQQAGVLTDTVRRAAMEMSHTAKTPYLAGQVQRERERGVRYGEEATRAAGSKESWDEFQRKEQKEGGPLVAPDMKNKVGELDDAYKNLNDTLAKLKEKFTAIIVRSNIEFFTNVLKVINWLLTKVLVLAEYVDRLSRVFKAFFSIPIVGFITGMMKLVAIWLLFGTVVPYVITLIMLKLAAMTGATGASALAFVHLGSYGSKALMWIFSPIHQIVGLLKLLGGAARAALRSIVLLVSGGKWKIFGAAVGTGTTAVHGLKLALYKAAAGVWAVLWPVLAIVGALLIVAEIASTITWLIQKLFGSTKDWASSTMALGRAMKNMFGSLIGGFGDTNSEMNRLNKEMDALNRIAGKPGESLAASFRALSQQDLFGGMMDQIINLPDRIMPSAMKLIQKQLGYAKNELTASYLGVVKVENEVAVRINLRDETGHALGDFVSFGP